MRRSRKILSGLLIVLAAALVFLDFLLSHDAACPDAAGRVSSPNSMSAIAHRCYGPPDALRVEQLPKPVPGDDEVLVRVHATSLNPLDWHLMRGTPYIVRLTTGLGKPDEPTLGVDYAGTVEAVGKNVSHFKVGDEVFGGRDGSFAQYVRVHSDHAIALKPTNMTFEQAAAVPIAGVTALQALRDKGQVKAGEKVLVNGASGGVGTFAVQIAKAMGAEVTGVCSTRNLQMVQALGADHVIDYTREDFTQGSQRYDVILDTVGNHPLLEYRHVLTPTGRFVIVGGPSTGHWIGALIVPLKALLLSPFLKQKFLPFLAQLTQPDLVVLQDLMQSGKVTPVIDRRYSLSALPEAMRYLEAGHARGKVVVDVE
ncbi:MAG TPA: NAD(P)-dependent alcohol dehydrogenase [Steroidobacteraceae bacterium]|jgi:NADPH:quinone reductase-like Zn-dependent oxidoreductase